MTTPICIPYFSETGHTAALARAIADGAGGARLIDIADMDNGDWAALRGAGLIAFGTPTYMGSVAARYGLFLEQAAEGWPDAGWQDKLAAGFTSACHPSGDKLQTLQRLAIFAAQMGMLWVGQTALGTPVNPDAPGVNRDGSWLGLMATDAGDAVPDHDLATARAFGARLRSAAERWG